MKIISHATLKKKTKRVLRVSNFALLWVNFKWHHGSEGLKGKWNHKPSGWLLHQRISTFCWCLSQAPACHLEIAARTAPGQRSWRSRRHHCRQRSPLHRIHARWCGHWSLWVSTQGKRWWLCCRSRRRSGLALHTSAPSSTQYLGNNTAWFLSWDLLFGCQERCVCVFSQNLCNIH